MPVNYALLNQYINPTSLRTRTAGVGGAVSPSYGGIFSSLGGQIGSSFGVAPDDGRATDGTTFEEYWAKPETQEIFARRGETKEQAEAYWNQLEPFQRNTVANSYVKYQDGEPILSGLNWEKETRDPLLALQEMFKKNAADNRALVDQYEADALPRYDAAAARANTERSALTGAQGYVMGGWNAADQAYLDEFRGSLDRGNAADQAALGGLQSLYGSINPVQLAGYQSAGPSRAAQAFADPASIAAQNRFLSQLTGVAGGSLNGVSQGAQAYADPASIAAQTRALNSLFAASGGSLDVTSQGAQAFADPNSIAGQQEALRRFQDMAAGGMDLESLAAAAAADPESIEAQKFALGKYKGLTDPTVTAEERFIMELARRNEEQDRRASVEAALRDLEVRGVRGSGAEIGALLGAQQTTSQNRMLQDLGAEANAIQRSQQALAGYTGLANTIRGQSFTEDFNTRAAGDAMNIANRDVRIRGVEDDASLQSRIRDQSFQEAFSRGSAADQVATANSNRRLAATSDAGNLASTQRGQSFSEAFNRGSAADNMFNQNANRQLAGMQAGAGLSSDMRNQSFGEAFNRGQAADAQERFNQGQQQQYNQFAANFGLQQNNDIWGRGTDLAGMQLDVTGRADARAGRAFDASTYTTRTMDERLRNYYDTRRGDISAATQLELGRIGLGGDILDTRLGSNRADQGNIYEGLKLQMGENAKNEAVRMAKEDDDGTYLFGLRFGG